MTQKATRNFLRLKKTIFSSGCSTHLRLRLWIMLYGSEMKRGSCVSLLHLLEKMTDKLSDSLSGGFLGS